MGGLCAVSRRSGCDVDGEWADGGLRVGSVRAFDALDSWPVGGPSSGGIVCSKCADRGLWFGPELAVDWLLGGQPRDS